MRLRDGAVATVAITERDEDAEAVAPEETAADVTEAEATDDNESNSEE